MPHYKITKRAVRNKEGKIIDYVDCIIADFENMSKNEMEAVKLYMQSGIKVYPKEEKKKSGKGITRDKINDYIEKLDDEVSIALKDRIENMKENKDNFMAISYYFKTVYKEFPGKVDIEKVQKRDKIFKELYKKEMTEKEQKEFKAKIKAV